EHCRGDGGAPHDRILRAGLDRSPARRTGEAGMSTGAQHHYTRRSGPSRAAINLLHLGPTKAAEAVKLRMLSLRQAVDVHVAPDGGVTVERLNDPRRKHALPEEWRLCTYLAGTPLADIVEDM